MIDRMANRRDRGHEAAWLARRIRIDVGGEIRNSRLNAGLSLRAAARAVGMSPAQFGRIERGELAQPNVEQLCRACAAVGLKLAVRAYPAGEAIRDAGQLALLGRFRIVLPAMTPWRTEVAIQIAGDLRAWDAVFGFPGEECAVEAETRLRDVQALERRIELKQRDSGIDRVILLVGDTAANRRTVGALREALRPRFPLDSRAVLAAVRAGHAPAGGGIVFL